MSGCTKLFNNTVCKQTKAVRWSTKTTLRNQAASVNISVESQVSSQLLTQLTQTEKVSREKRFVFELPKRSKRGELRGELWLLLSLRICA